MKKVIIDRATWINGRYAPNDYDRKNKFNWASPKFGNSKLINFLGMSCCLGFLGKTCGIQEQYLNDISKPDKRVTSLWPRLLFERNTQYELIVINDHPEVDDDIREAWIAEGFKTGLGYEVEFVGEYPDV